MSAHQEVKYTFLAPKLNLPFFSQGVIFSVSTPLIFDFPPFFHYENASWGFCKTPSLFPSLIFSIITGTINIIISLRISSLVPSAQNLSAHLPPVFKTDRPSIRNQRTCGRIYSGPNMFRPLICSPPSSAYSSYYACRQLLVLLDRRRRRWGRLGHKRWPL